LTNAKQAQVNEYLFYAQKLLQIESKQISGLDNQELSAIHASAYLCLKKAWDSWMQELADYMNVALEDFSSLSQPAVQHLPESQCLLTFKLDTDSWLNKLLDRIDDNYKATKPESIPAVRSGNNASLLDVVLIDGTAPLAETDILVLVMKEFKQYMQSVRSRQAEW